MTEKARIPAIRFKGFTDPWEQRKFADIFDYERPDKYIVSSDKYDDSNDTPVLTANKGFILGYTSEKKTYSKPCIIFDDFTLDCKYVDFKFMVKSSAMKILTAKIGINLIFAFERLNTAKIENLGHARHYISVVQPTETLVPEIEEQDRLAMIFSNLDNLITLHQRKEHGLLCEFLTIKPTLFFITNTTTWEQRKAKELFETYADKGHPDLPVLSATQDMGMVRRDDLGKNVFHDKSNEIGYKRVLPGQFVIHLRSFQGGFAHSAIEGITSPAYTIFGFKEPQNHDDYFWKFVFSSDEFIRRLETVTYGIRDGRSISYDEFLTMSFNVPSKAEQHEISISLLKLDNLITLHQRKKIFIRRNKYG